MFVHYEVAILETFWILTLGAASDRLSPSSRINDMKCLNLNTKKNKCLGKEVHWSHLTTFCDLSLMR